MNNILQTLRNESPELYTKAEETKRQASPILQRFLNYFPEYTDHSINHSESVLNYADLLLRNTLSELSSSELYVLVLGSYLHDIGMAPSTQKIEHLRRTQKELANFNDEEFSDYLREKHHILSHDFVLENWQLLGIKNKDYAKAVAKLCLGHRKVNLLDFEEFPYHFTVDIGKAVNIPFLAGVLKLADELDITSERVPEILFSNFYPSNLFSQQEWKKHQATRHVNVNVPYIEIKGEVTNQFLYERIEEQHNKIRQVLADVQKISSKLPSNASKTFLFHTLESNIEAIGFKPIKIGFTFDPQNTLESLIGKSLYRNKLVALREILQNAIDSCRYKGLSKKNYVPEITIYLEESRLIIEDNGFGMDEYIVKNYFSKLASSYYSSPHVSSSFESIGQFGIGVCSYLLLADAFDVETKMEGKEPLKFRVTKDALSYFHFYSDSNRKSVGTKITFDLSENINGESLITVIEKYIRFVEIPIKVYIDKKLEKVIKQKPVALDEDEELKKFVRSPYHNIIPDLSIIKASVKTDEYEAVLGLILKKDNESILQSSFFSQPETYMRGRGNIQISQQGIYINTPYNLNNTILRHTIGKTNFKKRQHTLSLDRLQIINDEYITEVVNKLEINILKKLFKIWKGQSQEKKNMLHRKLIYYDIHDSFSREKKLPQIFKNFVEANFILTCYKNGKFIFMTFEEVLKLKQFIIATEDTVKKEHDEKKYLETRIDIKYLADKTGMPILYLSSRYDEDDFYFQLLYNKNIDISVIQEKDVCLYKVNLESVDPKYNNSLERFTRMSIFPFSNDELLIADLKIGYGEILNSKHPIIQYFSENSSKYLEDESLKEYIDSFFETIKTMYGFSQTKESVLKRGQKFLDYINEKSGTKLQISENDFGQK